MFCFKLRPELFPLGFVLAICLLACQMRAASALQMPMADKPVKTEDEDSDVMRVQWFKLNPTGSRAKFEMPAKPRFVERTFTPVKGQPPIKVRLYIATALEGVVNFTFNYNDMNELPRGQQGITDTLEGVVRGSLVNVSGQLFSKTDIKLKGVRGRQFAYGFVDNKDQKYVALSRAFVKGRRLYQLTAVESVKKFEDFNEHVAARFLNSFQIVRAKPDLPPVPKAPAESESSKSP